MTQIGDIKRQKVRLEAMKKEAEEERERAKEAARERVLREFERGQLGLAATSAVSTSAGLDASSEGASIRSPLMPCFLTLCVFLYSLLHAPVST